jgi:hypothetical protein
VQIDFFNLCVALNIYLWRPLSYAESPVVDSNRIEVELDSEGEGAQTILKGGEDPEVVKTKRKVYRTLNFN